MGSKGITCAGSEPVIQYLDDETPFRECKRLLSEFSSPLSSETEARALRFLRHSSGENKSAYKLGRQNDLADWLLQQEEHTNACTAILLEVIADEKAEIQWREYCIQNLALALDQPVLNQEMTEQCLATLVEKSTDPRISFSGTALLGLYRCSQKSDPLIDSEDLAELAEYVLAASNFANANKVTALQVAGLSGSETALLMARKYVTDSSMPMQLRVSAIALIGRKGGQKDIPLLNNLTESLDLRLRKAAESALQKLTS